jgi:hypothetical protein
VAEKPQEMADYLFCQHTKKLTAQTFRISGTLVVFLCPLELDTYHLAHAKIREI